jgi:FO synthase subunit 2
VTIAEAGSAAGHPAIAPWAHELAGVLLQPPPAEPTPDHLQGLDPAELLVRLNVLGTSPPHQGLLSATGRHLVLELLQRPWPAPARELLRQCADQRRRELVGDGVSFVVNRNLNVSNHCVKHCSFCAFRRDPGQQGAYWLELSELQRRAAEAQASGATELCLQGGLNPAARVGGSAVAYAEALLRGLHQAAPGIHLHAFSPQELLFLAEQDGVPLSSVLERLRAAGLGSLPGTAAEVLTERVRLVLCPEKLSARHWVAVVLEAMAQGLAATSTLMAGHIEQPADRAAHLLTLLAMQQWAHGQRLPGFSEFVLLPFVGEAAPLALRQRVGRDQPDLAAMLLLTAQARLVLDGWIPNHQPSWVKLTLAGATEALRWGCNDLGGTLMEEHITTMAGARGGTCQSPQALTAAGLQLGRRPWQRTTLYAAAGPASAAAPAPLAPPVLQ